LLLLVAIDLYSFRRRLVALAATDGRNRADRLSPSEPDLSLGVFVNHLLIDAPRALAQHVRELVVARVDGLDEVVSQVGEGERARS
jgi:hypothetical protein